jgi:glycosyltransferase involved in cell wall biosynthesis
LSKSRVEGEEIIISIRYRGEMSQDFAPFHIAIFTGSPITSYGGAERYAIWIANELVKHDIHVTIFSQVNNSKENISLSAIQEMCEAEIVLFKTLPFKFIPFVPIFNAKNLKRLKCADTIYNIDESLFSGIFLSFYSKFRKKKYIYGMHIPESFLFGNLSAQSNFKKKIWHIYRFPLLVFFKSFVQNIHIINRKQLESLRSIGFSGNVHLIPNAVYRNAEKVVFNDGEFIVLFTGAQSVEIKGIDLLVDIIETTLKKEKGVNFCITGSSGNGTRLINELAAKYRNNVVNKGFVSEKELTELHKMASLFIITSRIESFSLGIVGAQGYGLPCIAFNIPGPSDIITKPLQGMLIDTFDCSNFSEAILKYYLIWKTNKEQFRLLKNNIQKNIYETLGSETIFPALLNMLTN